MTMNDTDLNDLAAVIKGLREYATDLERELLAALVQLRDERDTAVEKATFCHEQEQALRDCGASIVDSNVSEVLAWDKRHAEVCEKKPVTS